MRARLVSGLVAGVTAVAVAVGGTARPVQAAVPWTEIAVAVASSLFGSGGGGGDLERAKQEIIAAVNASRQEILDHVDAIANADIRACTESATVLVGQIDRMDDFTLAVFVVNAVDCATQSSAYFSAVQNVAAADNIGTLMGTIYSIAMVGFAKLGFPPVDLLDGLIRGYEAVVARLVPHCSHWWDFDDNPRWIYPVHITCELYPGKVGTETQHKGWPPGRPEPHISYTNAIANTDAQTSRGVAIKALPGLRAARAGA